MATFSLGTSGITPGAPGVYINEQPGKVAIGGIADFSTVYMLVETDEDVPVTRFPFNVPVAVSSLEDYKALIRVGNSSIPEARIPLLSYNCVNEFFQNSVTGDLRVVRVGTPNQIVEIAFNPAASKLNSTSLPSALQAGNKVYVQMILNGLKLVAGDGSTGYTADGEWLGVPVTIPVTYVAGDEANNRKISAAIATAVAEAIETNPAVRSSVYVRKTGMVNDLDPASNSEYSYVSIAATTFGGNVSVVTEVLPVGSNFVFMQNAYEVDNLVGGSVDLERVPQDYAQCIATAFDGVQDQGYLITPTAYAQFNAEGRALVGAAATAHCESNNFKWMALADPGPYLITDVNEYQSFTPHQAAADLTEGDEYLVDNAIYKWIGESVSYPKLAYQALAPGQSPEIAITESANRVPNATKVGLLDNAEYPISSTAGTEAFLFNLGTQSYWPVDLPIQKVSLSGASTGNDFTNAQVKGSASPATNLNGTEVYVIAAPYDISVSGEYSMNQVLLATSAADASNVYNAAVLAGGTSNLTFATLPNGAVFIQPAVGSTAQIAYADPYWDLPVNINGQTSDLIENISGAPAGVNTLHLPGTLQDPTETYRLNWVSRTIFNANTSVANYSGTEAAFAGAAVFAVTGHGLRNGQKIYFTQPIVESNGTLTQDLVSQTTKQVSNPYWVKAISENAFVVASSLANYTVGSYVGIAAGYSVSALPTIFYSQVLGGGETVISPTELITIPTVRARKYAFDSSSIFSQAAAAGAVAAAATNPTTSIYLNNSSLVLGNEQISAFGEDISASSLCGWLPELNLVAPTTSITPQVTNAYCVPTVDQYFQSEAYLVPAINPIDGGSFNPAGTSTLGPITSLSTSTPASGGVGGTLGPVTGVSVTGGTGSGATVDITIGNTAIVGPLASLGAITNPGSATATISAAFNTLFPGVSATIAGGTAGTGAQLDITVTDDGLGGPVAALGAVTNGTTDVPGPNPYAAVICSGGNGTGLTVDFDTDGAGNINPATLVINNPGNGYLYGDSVTVAFGTGTATIAISSINANLVVSSVALVPGFLGTGYDTSSSLSAAPASIANVTGFTVAVSAVTLPTGITNIVLNNPGVGYTALDILTIPSTNGATVATVQVAAVTGSAGLFTIPAGNYAIAAGLPNGGSAGNAQAIISRLVGVYFTATSNGFAPDGVTAITTNDRLVMTYDGNTYSWVVVPPASAGGDLTSAGQVCYGSQVEMVFTPEQGVPVDLWRFDAITSTEIIDDALRGVDFNGVPQAEFIEAGVDNVNRLLADSQLYGNAFGFIAYYGPYIENGAGQWIPPSPYVTGVAVRRYRAEGYQFPPAGVKYQLRDAVAVQIPVNSAQQNLLNPEGCNVVRTLPGYPDAAVFIWGGRTRLLNPNDAQQKLYQFVNTRVILNVVYGSLRTAFDNQIFNVIDGFNVIYNQIVLIGESILNQLYVRGALFGSKPSDAFQVICDPRINPPEDLENGIVNAKVFVTPVPTLERIQIDLIRVAIGQMQKELEVQGLGQ
jgi:hypothetical protein